MGEHPLSFCWVILQLSKIPSFENMGRIKYMLAQDTETCRRSVISLLRVSNVSIHVLFYGHLAEIFELVKGIA